MDAHIAQWIGSRADQEDSYAVRHFPEGSLAVVCDGMGGHDHGKLASSTAAEVFVRSFEESSATEELTVRLRQALDAANEAVGELFRDGGYGGTTLVGAFITPRAVLWVSVGDSGLYLYRGGRIRRLNEDHSMRAVMRRLAGGYGAGSSFASGFGNMLRSAVSGEALSLVDAPQYACPLLPGDCLLLTSDGADEVLESHSTLGVTALRAAGQSPAAAVVDACHALEDPYADNVTVISLSLGR